MTKLSNRDERPAPKLTPVFHSEDEEREFWATADSTEYVDWRTAQAATLAKLKPSTATATS